MDMQTELPPQAADPQQLAPASEKVSAALTDLKQAVRAKQAEAICTAYQQLKEANPSSAAAVRLTLATQAIGSAAVGIIVSAFAHRHCFMCQHGATPCRSCDGTGTLPGEDLSCPRCSGTGTRPCTFCNGTAWADAEMAPRELRRAVTQMQLGHVKEELRRATEILCTLKGKSLNTLPAKQRRSAVHWLRKIQARLADLSLRDELPAEQRGRLAEDAERMDVCIDRLTGF